MGCAPEKKRKENCRKSAHIGHKTLLWSHRQGDDLVKETFWGLIFYNFMFVVLVRVSMCPVVKHLLGTFTYTS